MRPLSSLRLFLGAVAALALSFSGSRQAQAQQPQPAPARPILPIVWQPLESAEIVLPDAPEAQNSTPAASPSSSTPQTTPASTATPPAAAPGPVDEKEQQRREAERELQQEKQQRLLGVVPNFNVVLNGHAAPLSSGQKWNLALHESIDPFYFVWAFAVGGGYSELVDSHSGYGWGPPGYFKRVGANYADNVNGELIGNAVLPQLLHQDPRYFRKGTGSIKSRIWVAALSTFVCYGDNGKRQANVSNILGNFISGAISNTYYPANERGVALTLENGTEVTLFGALGGQMYEFAPDIIQHLFHRHSASSTAPGAGRVTP